MSRSRAVGQTQACFFQVCARACHARLAERSQATDQLSSMPGPPPCRERVAAPRPGPTRRRPRGARRAWQCRAANCSALDGGKHLAGIARHREQLVTPLATVPVRCSQRAMSASDAVWRAIDRPVVGQRKGQWQAGGPHLPCELWFDRPAGTPLMIRRALGVEGRIDRRASQVAQCLRRRAPSHKNALRPPASSRRSTARESGRGDVAGVEIQAVYQGCRRRRDPCPPCTWSRLRSVPNCQGPGQTQTTFRMSRIAAPSGLPHCKRCRFRPGTRQCSNPGEYRWSSVATNSREREVAPPSHTHPRCNAG